MQIINAFAPKLFKRELKVILSLRISLNISILIINYKNEFIYYITTLKPSNTDDQCIYHYADLHLYVLNETLLI